MITLRFEGSMKQQFLDRGINRKLDANIAEVFAISGGSIMTTARRLLKRAAQRKLSDLTAPQLSAYRIAQKEYRKGIRKVKPRKPDKVSKKGKPPLLHSEDSILKRRLYFAIAKNQKSVVVGPELVSTQAKSKSRTGLSSIEELERRRPFMAKAFETIVPKLPGYLRAAAARR
jgi:hypothetical protein